MKQQISTPVAVAIVVVVLIVAGVVGFKVLGSPQRDVSPAEQIKMMQNMKK